ncbi:hypothetical protein F5X99DRAFT_385320, partial [Biscogniauxia marginata]
MQNDNLKGEKLLVIVIYLSGIVPCHAEILRDSACCIQLGTIMCHRTSYSFLGVAVIDANTRCSLGLHENALYVLTLKRV